MYQPTPEEQILVLEWEKEELERMNQDAQELMNWIDNNAGTVWELAVQDSEQKLMNWKNSPYSIRTK